jgi:hypothetical protein
MTITEFKAAAEELTRRMEAREPCGFRVKKLNSEPLPEIRCTQKVGDGEETTDYRKKNKVELRLTVNGKYAASITGIFRPGEVYGMDEMRFRPTDEWEKTGLNLEMMRRFVFGLDKIGCSYISTATLIEGFTFFKKLGLHLINAGIDIGFKVNKEGATVSGVMKKHWRYSALARSGAGWGVFPATAVIDLTDTPHRNTVFRNLGLPVEAKTNG